jgi:predicted aspartyl protease
MLVQYGPTLLVDIGFDPNLRPADLDLPDLAIKGVHALVDTGATASCIDSGLAMQLNLPIIDRQTVGGVGGAHEVNMHLAHIVVPGLQKCITGAFAGVNLVAGGQPHVALIGRTFLQHFTLFYNGRTGSVSITDELPIPTPTTSSAGPA